MEPFESVFIAWFLGWSQLGPSLGTPSCGFLTAWKLSSEKESGSAKSRKKISGLYDLASQVPLHHFHYSLAQNSHQLTWIEEET